MQCKKRCKPAQKSLNLNNEVANDSKAAPPGKTNRSRAYAMSQTVL